MEGGPPVTHAHLVRGVHFRQMTLIAFWVGVVPAVFLHLATTVRLLLLLNEMKTPLCQALDEVFGNGWLNSSPSSAESASVAIVYSQGWVNLALGKK